MAIDAGFGRITKHMGLMTGVAFSVGMQAQQGESGQIMIEEDVVLP